LNSLPNLAQQLQSVFRRHIFAIKSDWRSVCHSFQPLLDLFRRL